VADRGRPLKSADEYLPEAPVYPNKRRRCGRCGCRMSRYHPGELCWPCLAVTGRNLSLDNIMDK
jgi:hypothetical protein